MRSTTPWTNTFWRFAHTLAHTFDENKSAKKNEIIFNFFVNFGIILPCAKCAKHYNEYISDEAVLLGLHSAVRGGSDALVAWVIDMHNHVNRSLGKPTFSGERARIEHENFVNQSTLSGRWPTWSKVVVAACVCIVLLLVVKYTKA